MTSRGVRNNNPGNIDYNKSNAWEGQMGLEDGPNARFAKFDSPQNGIRALAKLLINYRTKAGTPGVGLTGIDTIREIIHRWAPGNENDTEAYIAAVAKTVGVKPNVPLDIKDRNILIKLVTAIIIHENGGNPYNVAVITEGVSRALK